MNKDSYHSMKRGLALSLVVHVILISWGAVQFTNSVSLPQPLEAIPITLAPLSEEFSSQQGAVEAPLHAIPAVKPTTAPQEIEDARHIGEGQRDSLAPFQPKEKPRSVETTPPLPSEHASEISERREPTEAKTEEISKAAEEASKLTPEVPLSAPEEASKLTSEEPLSASEEASKLTPEEPLSAPEEASKLTPEIPLSAPEEASKLTPEIPLSAPEEASKLTPELPVEALEEVSKIVSKPVHKNEERILPKELAPTVQKAPAEQVVQQAPKIALPEKPLLPHFKPKFNKELPMKNGAALNQKTSKLNKKNKEEKTIEDILALEENNLLNRARSQGGGAKRSHTPEALGARKNIHDTTKMAQTLVNIAGGCIQQKLKLVALGGDLKNRPIVRLRFYLDREGMVVGEPIIDPISGLKSQQAIMIRQVYAAVFSCQPYVDLPRDQYDLWGQGFDFNVDPLQEIR
ncbi:cell envelope biogenesis protein TolA [Bartonella krasnovii]|uniref:Cell envelope biogenesis protein TolA n=1 Tax=Bartonella krasnovii TaxID=2267275 RepID=A0A5B9D2R0_9HYPH|nr:cell envelope biogenesis protein TolA [Bartonella krasnovii]QEE12798.1 cell envelope biogenesis protein TolA [Bartonella krasnovii]UNF43645.1 cell envelope biogenesis protein TolA [Bartonella krasnovii]